MSKMICYCLSSVVGVWKAKRYQPILQGSGEIKIIKELYRSYCFCPQLLTRPLLVCILFSKLYVSKTWHHGHFRYSPHYFPIYRADYAVRSVRSAFSDCSGRNHKVNGRNVVCWLKYPDKRKKRISPHEWTHRSAFTVNLTYVPTPLIVKFFKASYWS